LTDSVKLTLQRRQWNRYLCNASARCWQQSLCIIRQHINQYYRYFSVTNCTAVNHHNKLNEKQVATAVHYSLRSPDVMPAAFRFNNKAQSKFEVGQPIHS